MPKVKRETSPTSSDTTPDSSPPTKSRKTKTSKTDTAASALKPGRAILAEEIIALGVKAAGGNVAALAEKTGMTPQQIKSQLASNRANLHKALLELAKSA